MLSRVWGSLESGTEHGLTQRGGREGLGQASLGPCPYTFYLCRLGHWWWNRFFNWRCICWFDSVADSDHDMISNKFHKSSKINYGVVILTHFEQDIPPMLNVFNFWVPSFLCLVFWSSLFSAELSSCQYTNPVVVFLGQHFGLEMSTIGGSIDLETVKTMEWTHHHSINILCAAILKAHFSLLPYSERQLFWHQCCGVGLGHSSDTLLSRIFACPCPQPYDLQRVG